MTEAPVAQRQHEYAIELHAYGFATPLLFDRLEGCNHAVMIERRRYRDDAELIEKLTATARLEATIRVYPLNAEGKRAGKAICYSGKIQVRTHSDSKLR